MLRELEWPVFQASSEHYVCFAVPETEVKAVAEALQSRFRQALVNGRLSQVAIIPNCSILAAVGQKTANTPGVSAHPRDIDYPRSRKKFFALPHIMGWDRLTNQKPSETVSFQPNRQLGGTVGFQLKMSPQILDLEWLAPLAHDMLRWQPERSYEQMSFVSRTNVLLVQILHFTNQEKTEDDYSRQVRKNQK
ncbi:hypothetical protein KIW84_074627 [Lathyrus oleraceus]|uniref:Uncharacterized protein n=1 Tax=Pisum sativum TaxID=3888 RepID=A0A9D4VUM5_PEA|nr:hypothetical protein KIW84_074627 [Pisum sativum]